MRAEACPTVWSRVHLQVEAFAQRSRVLLILRPHRAFLEPIQGRRRRHPDASALEIAALMTVETPGQSHVTFLLNFGDELQRTTPVGK